MDTRLNDTQRVLLSAYHDGELTPAEQLDVHRLLEESEAARQFLQDMRMLNRLSMQAFPPIPVDPSAAIGTAIGAKLTSSAIQSAARAASGATGASTGAATWTFAGLAAAAVATVAVIAVVGTGTRDTVQPERPRIASASTAAVPVAFAIDSASLVVPPMTTQEVVDFAVNGRVPIDADRDTYLTLGGRGQGESMAVTVADRASIDRMPSFDTEALGAIAGLDSIEFALRTALLRSRDHGLAVRADLPELRAHALRQLHGLAGRMPASLRRAFDAARVEFEGELATDGSEERGRSVNSHPDDAGRTPVRYFVLAGGVDAVEPGPTGIAELAFDDQQVLRAVEVSREALGNLEVYVRRPSALAASAQVTGGRTVRARAARRVDQAIFVEPPRSSGTGSTTDIQFEGNRLFGFPNGMVVIDIDSVLQAADEMIIQTERLIERADSLRNVVRIRIDHWYSREHPQKPPADPDDSARDDSPAAPEEGSPVDPGE